MSNNNEDGLLYSVLRDENNRLRAALSELYTRHAVVVMSRDKAEVAIERVRKHLEMWHEVDESQYCASCEAIRALDGAE